MADRSWLVPGARAMRMMACGSRQSVTLREKRGEWWLVRSDDSGADIEMHPDLLTPRPAEPAPEPDWDGTLHDRIHPTSGRLLASMPIRKPEPAPEPVPSLLAAVDAVRAEVPREVLDALPTDLASRVDHYVALARCTLCGVLLADESDVEAGYVTAFARDPADPTRCLSHGRTSLGASRG